MHQSTTPSLSQTIWPKWASGQFLSLPIVQTLLPVTFGYSLSSEAVVIGQLRRWKRLWQRSLTRSHKRTSMERYNKCTAAGGDLLKGTCFMWVLSIEVHIRKKSGNLFIDSRIYQISPINVFLLLYLFVIWWQRWFTVNITQMIIWIGIGLWKITQSFVEIFFYLTNSVIMKCHIEIYQIKWFFFVFAYIINPM